jgi:hypothetical protein
MTSIEKKKEKVRRTSQKKEISRALRKKPRMSVLLTLSVNIIITALERP